MLVSENIYEEISGSQIINKLGPPVEITFSAEGNLLPF
jgi:hypothetical protein